MRHDYDGAFLFDFVDGGLYLLGSYGVKRGRRFIEEDDGRVLEEHPGDSYPLLLSSRKEGRFRIESFRESHYLVVYARFLRRLHYLLESGVRFPVTDVLFDRAVEDMVFLEDQSDIFPKVFRIPFTKVHSVKGDRTGIRFVELVEEIDDRGLPRSAEAHKGGNLPAGDLERDIVKRLRPVGVREIHPLHLEVPLHLLGTVGPGGLDFRFGVDYVEIPLGIDEGVVQVIEYPLQL